MKMVRRLTVTGLALAAVLGISMANPAMAGPLDKKSPKIAHGMYRDRGKSSPKIAHGMYRDRGKSSPKIAHGIRTGYPMSHGGNGHMPGPGSFEELLPVAVDLVDLYTAAMDAGEFELADEVALDVNDLVDAYDRWFVRD
mgnify:CR=1 FL=1